MELSLNFRKNNPKTVPVVPEEAAVAWKEMPGEDVPVPPSQIPN